MTPQLPPTVTGSVRLEMRDPADLKPLSSVADLPGWEEDDPDFLAFCEDIKAHGILDPLLITQEDEIVDGRHRWRAAKRWQLAAVPVRVVAQTEQDELIGIQLSTLLHRRHYTDNQQAFCTYPFVRAMHKTASARRLQNLRKGQCSSETADSGYGENRVAEKGGKTTETEVLAAKLKISADTLQRVALLHRVFEEHPKPRKWDADKLRALDLNPKKRYSIRQIFEPQIMDRVKPMSVSHAVSGVGSILKQDEVEKLGGKHGGGKPKEPDKQLRLFQTTFDDLETRYEYWAEFTPEEKQAALVRVKGAVHKMPDDLLEELNRQVKSELKRRLAEPVN